MKHVGVGAQAKIEEDPFKSDKMTKQQAISVLVENDSISKASCVHIHNKSV